MRVHCSCAILSPWGISIWLPMKRLPKTLNFVEFEAGFIWKKHRKSVQRYESGPFALKGSSGPDAPRRAQVI